MITCDTMDTTASVQADARARCRRLPARAHHRADGQDARICEAIVAELASAVAVVHWSRTFHFKPEAAMEAVKWVEVVRVNLAITRTPRNLRSKNTRDEQYTAELKRIEEKFTPLVLDSQTPQASASHRHQSRLTLRRIIEPLWRHALPAVVDERAGICPHRPQARFPQLQVLDEVVQPQGE